MEEKDITTQKDTVLPVVASVVMDRDLCDNRRGVCCPVDHIPGTFQDTELSSPNIIM
jgi:hypothetical protein